MNIFSTPEFKVGILVVVVSSLIGVMSLKVAEGPGLFETGQTYDLVVDDAGGLIPNSSVKMAGIRVGQIEEIRLEGGKARIRLLLDDGVPINTNSRAQLKSDGILGDRHVELKNPGGVSSEQLPSGSLIPLKEGGPSGIDGVMTEVSRVSDSLNTLLGTLNEAVGEGSDATRVGRIVKNIEVLTEDLAQVTQENKGAIRRIMTRIDTLTENMDRYLGEQAFAKINRSLKNIEEITDKINRGEGTIGQLINDDETVNELNSAISNVNEFLGGAQEMETSIDFHSEFMGGANVAKSYLGIKIKPGLDRYYMIQAIDDPYGVEQSTFTKTTSGAGVTNTEDKTILYKNKIKITALFAKNFYDFTVKGGIIENSGGVGFDYHLLNRKLTLSTEFFDFGDLYNRTFARFNVMTGIYVTAGGDNLFGAQGRAANGFVGAGIFLTNDDLKTLASRISF